MEDPMKSRAERRRAAREAKLGQASGTVADGSCRFPDLFETDGCCICGGGDASECPCGSLVALVHLERAHPDQNSALMRDVIGCPIKDSKVVAYPSGPNLHQGYFEAPCGDTVEYATGFTFPTMGHYRWHAMYDHHSAGVCQSPRKCGDALRTGEV